VLVGRRAYHVAVGGDNRAGDEVVAAEPVLTRHPAHPAAQRQSPHSGVGDVAGRRRQPEGLGRPINRAEHRAALHPGAPADRIDRDAVAPGEVDHQAAVGDREAGDVVTAAPHADLKVVFACDAHRGDDVVAVGACRLPQPRPRDQR
jgi:hypothetical protein